MQRTPVIVFLAVLIFVLAGSSTAWAQGYGLYEQSPCAMGRAGAGVAAPCPDGSAVFFNPAGLSFEKTQIGLGGTLVGPRGYFNDITTSQVSTINNHWYPVPNIYISKPINKRFAAAIGTFAPYGWTIDWPTDSQGRYLGYKSLVQALYLQPTLAMKWSNSISVGAGVDITYLKVELRQRVDLSTQQLPTVPGIPPGATFAFLGVKAGTDFADLQLKGDAFHVGYHVGVLIKMGSRFSVGVRYLGNQNVAINDGTISTTQISTSYTLPITIPGVAPAGTPLDTLLKPQFAAGGTFSNQKATTQLPLPAQLVAGAAFQLTPKIKVVGDYQRTYWNKFDVFPINGDYLKSTITESYQNTWGGRLGLDYTLNPKTVIRAGFDYHNAAAPDQTVTPNLPEGRRQEYAAGFGRQLTTRFRIDAAYMRLQQPDRAGRTTNGGKTTPTAADNNGRYFFNANLFGISLTMTF
jgi:long-chain fatty acid transport protein